MALAEFNITLSLLKFQKRIWLFSFIVQTANFIIFLFLVSVLGGLDVGRFVVAVVELLMPLIMLSYPLAIALQIPILYMFSKSESNNLPFTKHKDVLIITTVSIVLLYFIFYVGSITGEPIYPDLSNIIILSTPFTYLLTIVTGIFVFISNRRYNSFVGKVS